MWQFLHTFGSCRCALCGIWRIKALQQQLKQGIHLRNSHACTPFDKVHPNHLFCVTTTCRTSDIQPATKSLIKSSICKLVVRFFLLANSFFTMWTKKWLLSKLRAAVLKLIEQKCCFWSQTFSTATAQMWVFNFYTFCCISKLWLFQRHSHSKDSGVLSEMSCILWWAKYLWSCCPEASCCHTSTKSVLCASLCDIWGCCELWTLTQARKIIFH
jgi:hypothetical protein